MFLQVYEARAMLVCLRKHRGFRKEVCQNIVEFLTTQKSLDLPEVGRIERTVYNIHSIRRYRVIAKDINKLRQYPFETAYDLPIPRSPSKCFLM